MDHINTVHSGYDPEHSEDGTFACTDDSIQETGNRSQMGIELLEGTSFRSVEVSCSITEINSVLISQEDLSNTLAGHQSDIVSPMVLSATESAHRLDVLSSQTQSTGTFFPTDLTGGIARSRKGMKLNEPEAFSELPETPSTLDLAPVLKKLGCSAPSFVARQKQRLAEKGDRLVSEVVSSATVSSAGPAYDMLGNTTSPNDQPSISSVKVDKTQSLITDAGDVSDPEKEVTKDLLAPRWTESSLHVYATYPTVVETMIMSEDLVSTHGSAQDCVANDGIGQLEFTENVLQASSTRMVDASAENVTLPVTRATFDSPYGSGIELEILGGVRGFNNDSSDEEDALEIDTNASGIAAFRDTARSQNSRKLGKKGFFRRMFRRVAKRVNKLKTPVTANPSLEIERSVASHSMNLAAEDELADEAETTKGAKKRTVRDPGEAITFNKTLN